MNELPIFDGQPLATTKNPLILLYRRIADELRWSVWSALNWLGLPGFVKPMQTYDRLTNTTIRVVVSGLFTIISVNGNDYYFRRSDGKYDGSGKAVK